MSVSGALFHGKLCRSVPMMQTKKLEETGPENMVCKLQKSIYGLQQVSPIWYEHFKSCLEKFEFAALSDLDCILVKTERREQIFLVFYVDDVLIVSRRIQMISRTKQELVKNIKNQDPGSAKNFLRVRNSEQAGSFSSAQSHYTEKFLAENGMKECRPVSTPMDPSHYENSTKKDKPTADGIAVVKGVPFRLAVGQLIYLASHTRPDIALAEATLSQKATNPRSLH